MPNTRTEASGAWATTTTKLTEDPVSDGSGTAAFGSLITSSHGSGSSSHNSQPFSAIAAAVVAGVAVLMLVLVWVFVKRRAAARASQAPPLRTSMIPNHSHRYSIGSPIAAEKVERSLSSVSYGFGTFGEDGCESPTITNRPDHDDDQVFAVDPLPPVSEHLETAFSGGGPTSGPMTEHMVTIPLGTPSVGIVLEQHVEGGPVVVAKIVPGSSAWLVQVPSDRVAVGDVLVGVQAIQLGRHHNLANARALLASQIDIAFKMGRPIRLTLGRAEK
jgi:hypothetical protein